MKLSIIKVTFLIISIFFFTCGSTQKVQEIRKINNSDLTKILNASEVIDLNNLSPSISKELIIKLYKIPIQGNCIEETTTTCCYHFYMAVSEFDENPKQAVFDLGEVGDIVNISWEDSKESNKAVLNFTSYNYPVFLLETHAELKKKMIEQSLNVSVDSILIN
jgi:hypothetical protein